MRSLTFTLTAVLLCAAPTSAQPSLTATVSPGVTSFGAGTAAEGSMSAAGTFEYLFRDERVRLVYELDAGSFSAPGDWRFMTNAAGASYKVTVNGSGSTALYVGGDGTLRHNGESWSAADFSGAGAFANLETKSGLATLRTGYRFDVRRFPDSPAMNQAQHAAFGSVLVTFQTRTTLIGEVNVGSKHYDAVSPRTEVLTVRTGEPTAHADGMQGRGVGWRAMSNVTLVPVAVPGSPGSAARQFTIFARVAQSLADRTGLSIEVSRRRVAGEVPPAVVATPPLFIDDGIYDDLFASDATRGGVTLKSIVGHGVELMGAASWSDKQYGSTYAFDEEGIVIPGLLRHDRVTAAQAFVTWPLAPSKTGGVALDLIGGYDYTRHRSTSALYRYTAHTVRVAFGVGF